MQTKSSGFSLNISCWLGRLPVVVLLLTLAALCLTPPTWAAKNTPPALALTAADRAWLVAHPVIRLGIDPGYAPYTFLDDSGRPQGIAIELIEHLGPALGVRFEFVSNLDWPQLMAAVEAHQIDAVATVAYRPEREAFLAFTAIYLPTPQVITTRKETPQLTSTEDLTQLKLVLVAGYSSSKEVMALYPALKPHYVANPLDGLRAVASGEADAYVGALGVNSYLAAHNGLNNLKANAGFDMKVNGQRFGVRKDWPELAHILDQALANIPAQTKNDAFQKWLPLHAQAIQRLSKPTLITRLFPWLLGLATLALLGYLATLIWNRQLKQELARRQSALIESAARLQAAESIAQLGHWQYNMSNAEMIWSDESYRIFGLQPQSRTIDYDWLLAHVHPDDRTKHDGYLQRMLNSQPGDTLPDLRYRIVRDHDDVRTVHVRARIEFDAQGKPHALFGTLQDISEQIRASENLATLNRLYRVLGGINEAIIRYRNPQRLFEEACRIAVELGGFRMAWVGLLDTESNEVRLVAHAGATDHYLDQLHISLGDDETARGPTGTALRAGQHAVSNDIAHDPHMSPWRQSALALGYQSSAAFPVKVGGKVRGTFNLYADRTGFFDAEELRLLDDLAEDIGFALEFIESDQARETLNNRMVDLLEGMSDGFLSLSRDWCCQYVNRRAGEMLDRTPAELTGKNIWAEFPDGSGQPFQMAYERVMSSGKMTRIEAYYPPLKQWFENRIYPTQDGISIFFTDITERKYQEAERKRLHSTLNALVEGSTDAIFVKDLDGRYIVVNQALVSLLGIPADEIIGADDYALFDTASAERFRADDQRIMKTDVARTYEETVMVLASSQSYLTTKGPLIIDGEVRGVFGLSRNITARKAAETALIESESRLRLFVEHAPAALAMFDRDMRYLAASRRWMTAYQLEHSDILGRSHYAIFPDLPEYWKAIHQRGMAGELVRSKQEKFVRADGRIQWLTWEMRPWFAADSSVGGIVIFSEDITERVLIEQSLRESEIRFRQLFEQNPLPMLVYARGSLEMLAVNDAFERHYGYTHDEALVLLLTDLYPDDEKQAITDVAAQLVGLAHVGEWHHLKKDGSCITVEARSHDILFENRQARVAVITDISVRKEAEQIIQKNEARYRSLLEMAPFPAVLTRMRDGILVYGNHRAEIQYGISRDQGIGQPAAAFYQDSTQRLRFTEMLQTQGTVDDLEVRMLTATGEPFWAMVSASIVEFDNEPAIFTAINDISSRKQAELALQEQEAFFRLIAENMGDMVAVLDLEGRRLYNSPSYQALFGDPIALKGTDSFLDIHPDDREQVRQQFMDTVQTGHGHRIDFRFVLANGEVRHIESQGGVIRNPEGDVERVVVVSRDVTDRKQLETEIRCFNVELEERVRLRTAELATANKELETFTYSVSHDLKAPLRGIDGYSRLLLEDYQDQLGAAGTQLINKVRNGVTQMNQLIEDLLTYSRMERRSLNEQALDLTKLVNNVLENMQSDIQARSMVIEVDLANLAARADPEGLTIVVRNLIDNALKFTRDSHPPRLSISGLANDKSVTLKFTDNGIGFDMQFHHRIFEIFQRLQRAEDYAGTGVGLAIVYKAMQRMGGRVWAESAPGQGASFYLELPR
ncbi:MAG TPA: PAS domain S-box protein [Thiobacillus sp.]